LSVNVGTVLAYLDLQDSLTSKLQLAANNVNQFANRVNAMGATMSRVGGQMQATGTMMTAALTVPLVGLGLKSATVFADFERGMNNVAAVSGATADEFAQLTAQAEELGRTTQYTARQAGEAMGFMSMAGFKANEILGAMPSVLQLAASAQLDMGRAADITTNILSGYGLAVEDLGHANDVLVKAFTSANTNLEQLGQAFKFAGPVAKSAGVSFESSAAAMALMGNAGIQASMAGTGLRGAITRLIDPTKQAADAMLAAGINAKDASGKLLPLDQIIQQLEPHAENTALMMEVFGLRAGPAMMALVSQGSDALRELTTELENSGGIAQRIAEVQMKGLKGAWYEAESAVEGLLIAIGKQLSPALSQLLLVISDVAYTLQNVFLPTIGSLPTPIQAIGLGLLAVTALIGPMTFILGTLVKGFGGLATAGAWVTKQMLQASGALTTYSIAARAAAAASVTTSTAMTTSATVTAAAGASAGVLGRVLGGVSAAFALLFSKVGLLIGAGVALSAWAATNASAVDGWKGKVAAAVPIVGQLGLIVNTLRLKFSDLTMPIKDATEKLKEFADQRAKMVEKNALSLPSAATARGIMNRADRAASGQSLVDELANSKAILAELTVEQRKNIDAGLALGKNVTEIAARIGKSQAVVELYSQGLDKAAESTKNVTKQTEDLEALLGKFNLITPTSMAKSLKEISDAMNLAVRQGAPLASVTALLIPAYDELQEKARQSGVGLDLVTKAKQSALIAAGLLTKDGVLPMRNALGSLVMTLPTVESGVDDATREFMHWQNEMGITASALRFFNDPVAKLSEDLTKQHQALNRLYSEYRAGRVMLGQYENAEKQVLKTTEDLLDAMGAGGMLDVLRSLRFTLPGMGFEAFNAILGETERVIGDNVTETKTWEQQLDKLGTSFSELARVADGSLGSIADAVAQVTSSLKLAKDGGDAFAVGLKALKAGETTEGITGMVAGLASVVAAFDAATSSANRFQNAVGGTLVGAQAGASLTGGNPLGAIVGGIAGFIGGLFKSTTGELNKLRNEILSSAGGMNELRKMADFANLSVERVLKAKSVEGMKREWEYLQKAVELMKKRIDDLGRSLESASTHNLALTAKMFREMSSLSGKEGMDAILGKFITDQTKNAADSLLAMVTNLNLTERTAGAAVGAMAKLFEELKVQGYTTREALEMIDPHIDALLKQFETMGIGGGEAFDRIRAQASYFADEGVAKVLDGVAGITDSITAFHNLRWLTPEMFADFSSGLVDARQQLVDMAKDAALARGEAVDLVAVGAQSLAALAPEIQRIWELKTDFGYAVDDATMKLIEEAEAAGLVGDQFRSSESLMTTAIKNLTTALEGLIVTLGGTLPQSAIDGARGVQDALNGINPPEIRIPFYYDEIGAPDATNSSSLNRAGGGVIPLRPYGTDRVNLWATPGEGIVSTYGMQRIGQEGLNAINSGGSFGGGETRVVFKLGRKVLVDEVIKTGPSRFKVHGVGSR
jgi:TP901 family phage tail tape measure protein